MNSSLNYSDTANRFARYQAPQVQRSAVRSQRRFRFRPRSFWPFLTWGFLLFMAFRVLFFPLMEGIYNYCLKTQEINQLQVTQQNLQQQLAQLKKVRKKMQTMSYVEERGHQIGLIKPNEEPLLVINSRTGRQGVLKMTKQVSEYGD